MWNRNEVTEVRERFANGEGDVLRQPTAEKWARVFGTFAVLFVASVAAGVLLAGCGGGERSSAQVSDNAPAVMTHEAQATQVASVTPAPAKPVQSGLSAADLAVKEGLPPDLTVTTSDTLVVPGGTVEFTVSGTDDVSEIALSDGRDEPTPFVHEAGTNVWRATYRMPLKPRHERLGVSVTARNDLNRWRRVWVFLSVDKGEAQAAAAAETPADNPDEIPNEK